MKSVLVLLSVFLFSACSTTLPVSVSSNRVGVKGGEVCASYILGFIPMGNKDITISNAARTHGIKKISSVDYTFTNYLVYTKSCTHVNGN